MRLTVNLAPDAYGIASAYAQANGMTLSVALGELIRRAEQILQTETVSTRLELNEYGYLEIVGTGTPITPEMVKATEDALI
jgi:hypothetical protein